mmetsp:Transcript_128102/g.370824  ORF Transcript_128102/g.370824 Transcript_128102/m.370824 type:complete len:249 (-) Transcript_128102:102-848(-)
MKSTGSSTTQSCSASDASGDINELTAVGVDDKYSGDEDYDGGGSAPASEYSEPWSLFRNGSDDVLRPLPVTEMNVVMSPFDLPLFVHPALPMMPNEARGSTVLSTAVHSSGTQHDQGGPVSVVDGAMASWASAPIPPPPGLGSDMEKQQASGKTPPNDGAASLLGGDSMAWSVGSALHASGGCKPCVYHMQATCILGVGCTYCHLEHETTNWKRSRAPKHVREKLKAHRKIFHREAAAPPATAFPVSL